LSTEKQSPKQAEALRDFKIPDRLADDVLAMVASDRQRLQYEQSLYDLWRSSAGCRTLESMTSLPSDGRLSNTNHGRAAMEYDGIIVGAGHNGLICASYLAKAGLKIAVVERNDVGRRLLHERIRRPRLQA
jgi:hypothetical protein